MTTTTTPYETLVESAALLTDVDALADIDQANISEASELLQRNTLALESARRALGPNCMVPVRYEEAFFSEHRDHFPRLGNLARAFRAEAWLAASRSEYRSAAVIGIDILELANAARRGGLVTDLLVGVAISGIAMEVLRKIRAKIDNATRRLLIDELHRLEIEREPFADIVARDRDWEVAVGQDDKPREFMSRELSDPEECGLSEEEQKEILQLLQQLVELPEPEQRKMQRDPDDQILALMRMLAIDLALQDYYANSGSLPDELISLMPWPFPKIPLDPFTNQPFIYRRLSGESFCLYSTGPKLFDGGGRFGSWPSVAAGSADLCLDAGDYWPNCCTLQQSAGLVEQITAAIRRWRYAWRR